MTCPICDRETSPKYRPFCSGRCADVDLGKWLSGDYAVASEDPEEQAEALEELSRQPPPLH